MNCLLVGGPSDGKRVEVERMDPFMRVMDPPQGLRDPFQAMDPMTQWAGDSTYELTTIHINGNQLHIYAYRGLDLYDAWHRLIHRYPNPHA